MKVFSLFTFFLPFRQFLKIKVKGYNIGFDFES